MTQLQETENRTSPAATTWAAEFLLRPGESCEILGQWMSSNEVQENKRTQVITCSFPFLWCASGVWVLKRRVVPKQCSRCRDDGVWVPRGATGACNASGGVYGASGAPGACVVH